MTINQIKRKLKEIQENHLRLNSFYFGNLSNIDRQDRDYSILAADLIPGNLSRGVRQYRLTLIVADLVNEDESNLTEVLSDTERDLLDVYSQLWEYFEVNDVELVKEGAITDFSERWDDNVAGYSLDITINVFFSNDRCQIPSTLPPPEGSTNTGYSVRWGRITGQLTDQTDLVEYVSFPNIGGDPTGNEALVNYIDEQLSEIPESTPVYDISSARYSGKRYTFPATVPNQGTGFGPGVLIVCPIPVGEPHNITAITAYVSTAHASSIRLGLYEDINGYPGNLIIDSGNISCATTGAKTYVFPSPISLTGRLIFAAIFVESSSVGLDYLQGVIPLLARGGVSVAASQYRYQPNAGVFGAMPATYLAGLSSVAGWGIMLELTKE